MMTGLKGLIFFLFILGGYLMGASFGYPIVGTVIGVALSVLSFFAEPLFHRVVLGRIFGAFIGLFIGLAFAKMVLIPFQPLLKGKFEVLNYIITALFGYTGMLIGATKGKGLSISAILKSLKGQAMEENQKVLDTSVIIDGRIADIAETGFIEGTLIIPQFVLRELQHIADSADSLRRARGRRGLDVLHRLQKMSNIAVRIIEDDYPHVKDVDLKLVALARDLNAKLLTNDYNLNKVAELQGVPVLNINELANALKPVVLPGESMNVFVLKEGKEPNQGVAYMDDGTMVVVENGRPFIGKNIDVTVTSVLQTTAGRMIFTRVREEYAREEAKARRH